ncbi:hypothetical protein [Rhodopirellula sp. MGV]|uniref:hypothetical protein n=1 Tax=Rhodopirellula sp. MGV TaxID=2023130 RepID=UPI00130450F1|nr:hypothetical protein [Rhodopirellula sp. MGV]
MSLPIASGAADAHHPDRENQTVHQRVDLIGPVGNRLPAGYRRTYNRPTYIGGKVAYYIAPSSQEAMAWHRAEHRGLYNEPCRDKRVTDLYFYPKPWEALLTGPRRQTDAPTASVVLPPTEEMILEEQIDALEVPMEIPGPVLEAPSKEDFESSSASDHHHHQASSSAVNLASPASHAGVLQQSSGVQGFFDSDSPFGLASNEVPGTAADFAVDAPEMVIPATGNQAKDPQPKKKLSMLSVLKAPVYLRFSPKENVSAE